MSLPMIVAGVRHATSGHPIAGIVLWTLATHSATLIGVPVVAVALWRNSDSAYLLSLPVTLNILVHSAYLWWLVDCELARMTDTVIAGPAVAAVVTLLLLFVVAIRRIRDPS